MKPAYVRILVLVLGIALFLGTVGTVIWRVLFWNNIGTTGVVYQVLPELRKNQKALPDLGFAGWMMRDGAVVVVDELGPGHLAGIRVGDEITAVNGIPRADRKALQRLETSVSGSTVVYTLNREGRVLSVPVTLSSPYRRLVRLLSPVSSVVVGGVFLLLSIVVYWMRPGDRRAFVFYLMCTVAALFFLLSSIPDLEMRQQRGIQPAQMVEPGAIILLVFYGAAAILLTSLLLHLALVFPRDNPVLARHPRALRWVYAGPVWPLIAAVPVLASLGAKSKLFIILGLLSLILLIAATSIRIRRVGGGRWRRGLLDAPFTSMLMLSGLVVLLVQPMRLVPKEYAVVAGMILGITFGACWVLVYTSFPILTVVSLVSSYRRSNAEEKRQVRWPLWGSIVGVGGSAILSFGVTIAVALLPRELAGATATLLSLQAATKFLYVLIPLSFAFAILKYRLMEIDVVIRKTVIYTAVSGIVIALYYIFVAGLGAVLLDIFPTESRVVIIISTLGVAGMVIPLRNRVQRIVDRSFFRERQDYPQMLRAMTREIHEATELQPMLDAAAERIQQTLRCSSVVMFFRSNRDLQPHSKVGLAEEVVARISFSGEPLWLAQLDGAAAVESLDLSEEEQGKMRRLRAAALVPVRSTSRDLGFIVAGSKLSDSRYGDDDLDFLTSAAAQIAVKAEALRLRNDEEDFEQARTIQQGLLPRAVPQISGVRVTGAWLPARTVSGDYYDVIRLSESKQALCIADVAGKGMPAALLMSSLQAAVRAIAGESVSPRQLCERVGRVIAANVMSGRFITFFFAVIDGSRRTITYCNAGHNPPILMRADGETLRLALGGPVFGRLFQNARYLEEEVPLHAGDRLLLYTDGVTEARNGADEEFGEGRLLDILSAAGPGVSPGELERAVLDAVTSFSTGALADDVTLVIATID